MKAATVLLLNAALANAHWITSNLIFNNKITGQFEYVRQVSPYTATATDAETALAYPNTFPDSTDLRCGRNATLGWSKPKVATVKAGEKVGFFVGRGITTPPNMYHPGFASAWLSKVESGELDAYKGDGDWYKITQTAGRSDQSVNFTDPANKPYNDSIKGLWGTFRAASWNFTIPATTPPGKYLVRWEHIFPNAVDAQYYVNCGHLEVTNAGTAVKPAAQYLVKIPGVYTRGQKDVYFSTYDYGLKGSLDGFVNPKPDVWMG